MMSKFAYRCMRCRTRNMFIKELEEYARGKKCKSCGHNRFYWDKARNFRTFKDCRTAETCHCGNYQHPHRPGIKYCEKNPNSEFLIRTERYKEEAAEVALDIAFRLGGQVMLPNEPPPF